MQSTQPKLSNQVQAIKHFIEKMDIEMIDAFLENDITYQNFEKSIFISKLQDVFEKFQNLGDTHLIATEGSCNKCDKSRTGYLFVGNISECYMNLIFETSNDTVDNLFECNSFNTHGIEVNMFKRICIRYHEDTDFPF